jgi:hypothetical protein
MTWLMGMASGAVLAFATPTAILASVLLAPAILIAVFDSQPGRATTRVVFVAVAGLAFGPIWHLNASGPTIASALEMLCEPAVLCPAWLAGACSWGVCEYLPLLLLAAANRTATARIAALLEEAQALQAEWDLADPAG